MCASLNTRILRDHRPDPNALLVVLPCSSKKPYCSSRSQRLYRKAVLEVVGSCSSSVEFATLSSLHGIVPDAFSDSPQAMDYDLNLNRCSSVRQAGMTPAQARARAVRLASLFLYRFGRVYRGVVGYGRENYCRVFSELRRSHFPKMIVLPTGGKSLSGVGLDELKRYVRVFSNHEPRLDE